MKAHYCKGSCICMKCYLKTGCENLKMHTVNHKKNVIDTATKATAEWNE